LIIIHGRERRQPDARSAAAAFRFVLRGTILYNLW
jgi:hypothetical protein